MNAKLFQVLGLLFVVLLIGCSLGGLMLVKDRVRIVVQSDEATSAPDPSALLRDEVQVLSHDLAALAPAIGKWLEQLAADVESRAAARHAEVMGLRQDVAALQQRVEALGRELAAARTEMAQQVAAAMAAAMATHQPESVVGGETVGGKTGANVEKPVPLTASPPAVAVPTAPEPTPPAVPATKATAGFLSFTLPSAAFHFDQPADYRLLPELCRVGFDAKTTLHDFSGVTSTVAGHFHADFDDAAGAWTGEVTAQAATLVTGIEGRDTNLREYLDTEHHAAIRFDIERFVPAANGVDVARQTARGDIFGKLTIRDRTQPLTMPVSIEVDPQQRVVISGQVPLKLSDYGVVVPSQLGVISMQDEVVIWIALRARVQPGAGK